MVTVCPFQGVIIATIPKFPAAAGTGFACFGQTMHPPCEEGNYLFIDKSASIE
jgi:hypothetical protein